MWMHSFLRSAGPTFRSIEHGIECLATVLCISSPEYSIFSPTIPVLRCEMERACMKDVRGRGDQEECGSSTQRLAFAVLLELTWLTMLKIKFLTDFMSVGASSYDAEGVREGGQ